MSTTEFSSLYSSGDIILQNPIESSAIFLVVVVMCSSIEYLFSLAGDVESKFFRVMFDTISEEILVVGVLSLLLTFGSSVIRSLPPSWSTMFQWAHICLLFMGIMFIALLSAVMFFVFSGNSKWKKFESVRLRAGTEGMKVSERDYAAAVDKFKLALRAFDYPTNVPLSEYLLKAEKKNLIALGNLSWKSWLALSTIVVLNALRTKVVTEIFPDPDPLDPDIILDQTGNIVNVAVFIVICGYGTLALFLGINRQLQRRYRQYLMLNNGPRGVDRDRAEDDQDIQVTRLDLDDPQSFLLWQSLSNSIALVQAVLMFLVWYSAVFFLNIVYQTFTFNIALTLMFLIAAMLPMVIFVIWVPGTLTAIALLSTLGTNLNETWVKALLQERGKLEAVTALQQAEAGKNSAPVAPTQSKKAAVEKRSARPLIIDDESLVRLSQHHSVKRLKQEGRLTGGGASPPQRAQSGHHLL